jgi:SAM-dependent methyltransferase
VTDQTDSHASVTQRQWDEHMSAWFERYARPRWAAVEPYWGMWCISQSQLPVLPASPAGATAVEFGCGSAYVSAWLARRGARPVGVDISVRQLIEVKVPPGATNNDFPEFPDEWVRRWPAEEVWFARRGPATACAR